MAVNDCLAMNDAECGRFVEDLRRLIRLPSCSTPDGGEEARVQSVMAELMRGTGARVRMFEPDDIPGFRAHPLCCGPHRTYRGRPTVVGELGPADAPALLLLAHSDTVPLPEPEKWTCDPFGGEVRNGRIYGLGAHDDKWGLAAILAIMRSLQQSGAALRKRMIFVSTIDEESGVGNGLLLLMLAGIRADAALYLDGGRMDINIGNLGGSNLYLRPRQPISPEDFLRHSDILHSACHARSRIRAGLFARPLFDKNTVRDKSCIFYRKHDGAGSFFQISFYTLPGEDRETTGRELEGMVRQSLGAESERYTMQYREPWFEPALISADQPLVQCLANAVRALSGCAPRITTITKQDAFIFQNHAGIPTVSFGPGPRDGEGVNHNPNESISIEDAWLGCRIACRAVRLWLEERS